MDDHTDVKMVRAYIEGMIDSRYNDIYSPEERYAVIALRDVVRMINKTFFGSEYGEAENNRENI